MMRKELTPSADDVIDVSNSTSANAAFPIPKTKRGYKSKSGILRHAIIAAAEYVGSRDFPEVQAEIASGLTAYLVNAARENPQGFVRLLGQVLPHMNSDSSVFVYNLHLDFSPPSNESIRPEESPHDD